MSEVQRTISPVDGRVVEERELASAPQIDATLQRAVEAQQGWRATPLVDRIAILSRFVDRMESRADAIGEELTWQMGRPVRYSPNEIRRGFAERARFLIASSPRSPGRCRGIAPSPASHASSVANRWEWYSPSLPGTIRISAR